MGDRANCVVIDGSNPPVYLYTHWGGHDLLRTVQHAIKRLQRWDDPSYLTRIIFDHMTEGQHGKVTGFGISTSIQDNEHDLVYVDTEKQEIRVGEHTWSFRDFCTENVSGVKF